MIQDAVISQIALSVRDRQRTSDWYEGLGLRHSGSIGPLTDEAFAAVIEVERINVSIDFVLGRDSMTQLELIEFSEPEPRSPGGWTAARQGYGVISIVVPDFETIHRRFVAEGAPLHLSGSAGSRSLFVSDPNDVWVELLERDPLAGTPVAAGCEGLSAIRGISVTVEDIDRTASFWSGVCGFARSGDGADLFNELPPALAGDARFRQQVLRAGPTLVRLLEPQDGALAPRDAGHHLTDIGVLNISMSLPDRDRYFAYVDQLNRGGFRGATPAPQEPFDGAAMYYGYDFQGLSLEVSYIKPGVEEGFGWKR